MVVYLVPHSYLPLYQCRQVDIFIYHLTSYYRRWEFILSHILIPLYSSADRLIYLFIILPQTIVDGVYQVPHSYPTLFQCRQVDIFIYHLTSYYRRWEYILSHILIPLYSSADRLIYLFIILPHTIVDGSLSGPTFLSHFIPVPTG